MSCGCTLGTRDYIEQYVKDNVQIQTNDVQVIDLIAKTQTHAAYAAFIHNMSNKWTIYYDIAIIVYVYRISHLYICVCVCMIRYILTQSP